MQTINYDSSLYLYIRVFIYKKTADSAHCDVIYFVIFSSSISHSDVTYFIKLKKTEGKIYEDGKEK